MLCAYMRPRYQVSVYRTIGPLVLLWVVYVIVISIYVLKSKLMDNYKAKLSLTVKYAPVLFTQSFLA